MQTSVIMLAHASFSRATRPGHTTRSRKSFALLHDFEEATCKLGVSIQENLHCIVLSFVEAVSHSPRIQPCFVMHFAMGSLFDEFLVARAKAQRCISTQLAPDGSPTRQNKALFLTTFIAYGEPSESRPAVDRSSSTAAPTMAANIFPYTEAQGPGLSLLSAH